MSADIEMTKETTPINKVAPNDAKDKKLEKKVGFLENVWKFKKFYEMDDLLEKNLHDVLELDEKNKKPIYKMLAFFNIWIVYIISLVIFIQVIIASVNKFGKVSSSTTSFDMEKVQTFEFKAEDFKHYFLAEFIEDEENLMDIQADKYATETGQTWTASSDGSNLQYTIDAY